jgi:hypothetical protein
MQIRYRLQLTVSPTVLFDLLHDYSLRSQWDTFTPDAELLDAGAAARGVAVRCTDKHGRTMVTRYCAFDRPHVATVRMTHGPWPFVRFGGCWRIVARGDRNCELMVSYHITTRPAWAQPLLDPLVGLLFSYHTRKRLRALQQFILSRH